MRLPGGVELWTLEPFRRDRDGTVSARLSHRQLQWLTSSLRRSTARWKIVQSEIPPASSDGFLGRHTSGTHLLDAPRVLRVLGRHGADLLLSAEFHQVDALERRGVPEIIHGGDLMFGRTNFLVIRVYARRLDLTSMKMARARRNWTHRLWAPAAKRPPAVIHEPLGVRVAGQMTITRHGVVSARGDLTLR